MTNAYFHLLKMSWYYAAGQRWRVLLIYACFLIGLLLTSILPWLYGWFINAIQSDGINALMSAWIYVAAYIGINLAKWLFYGYPRIMEQSLGFYIGRNFTMETYEEVLFRDMLWHHDRHSGDVISRVKKASDALKNFYQSGFLYFHAIGRFVLSAAAMLYFTPSFGAAGIILGILAVVITLKFDKPLIRHLNESNEKEHAVSSGLTDSLSNITTIKTLRLEKQMSANLLGRIMDVLLPFRKAAVLGEWKWFATDMMVGLIYCLLIMGYLIRNVNAAGMMQIGGLVTLIAYVTQFTSVFYEFAWQYNQLVKYYVDVRGIDEIRQVKEFLPARYIEQQQDASWKCIEISGINFSHASRQPGRTGFNISGITLKLKRGKRIAVIGSSGGGKTTILNLLRGLYDFQRPPRIILDGDGGRTKTPPELYNQVVLFPQEPEIFENTVRYNLTLGLDHDEENILRACEVACFSDVLSNLPRGLDTRINEKGVNLSGGERQRLALARGVLLAGGVPIVLMDEPTSSIDIKNERKIYQQIFNQFSDSVILSTVHRLYLLPLFDYIYIINNGKVVAEGDYSHIKNSNDWLKQMMLYQDDYSSTNASPASP